MPASQNIPILNRTLRVLEAVTERGQASAKQLSIDLGIPLATCYRILNTLADAHWLRRDAVGDYELSFGISRLGGLAGDMARFFGVAHPRLRELAHATGCSVKISAREGDDWLILARFEQPQNTGISLEAGSRDCVVVGSVGAVLVRQLDDAEIERILRDNPSSNITGAKDGVRARVRYCREHGHAHDFGQTNPNIHAVSIPLSLAPMEDNAAITLFGAPTELPEADLANALRQLAATARAIQAAFQSD